MVPCIMYLNVVVSHLKSCVKMYALHKVRYDSEWLSVTHQNDSSSLVNGDCDENAIAMIQRFTSNIDIS